MFANTSWSGQSWPNVPPMDERDERKNATAGEGTSNGLRARGRPSRRVPFLATLALIACAAAPEESSDSLVTSQGALVAGDAGLLEASTAQEATLATSIPSGTAALLRRTCPVVLSARDELLRFGKSGAPPAFREPRRIVRPAEVRAFTKDGTTLLVPQFSGPSATRKTARADRLPEVKLGVATSNGMHLVEPRTRLTADVQMLDTRAVTAMQADGMLVYPAGAEEGDLVVRPTPEGPEDYVLYASKPRQEQVRYRVELGPQVASVRLVGRTVELLDSGGVPRLRMSPPTLVDGACQTFQPRVQVTGCAVDTSPRLPMRRPHPAPGASACTVHVSWAGMGVTYPATLDPAWSGTELGMGQARWAHTATPVVVAGNPVVLLAGGLSETGQSLLSTEYFDEATRTCSPGAPMSVARSKHAATRLADGRVLVVGGENTAGSLKSAEIFAPDSVPEPSFVPAPDLPVPIGTTYLTLDTLADGKALPLEAMAPRPRPTSTIPRPPRGERPSRCPTSVSLTRRWSWAVTCISSAGTNARPTGSTGYRKIAWPSSYPAHREPSNTSGLRSRTARGRGRR